MVETVNRVELLGRLGTAPDIDYTSYGTALGRLSLVTERTDGEDTTDWHTVLYSGRLAEAVYEHVGKGQRIYVAGRLAQNSWEDEEGQRLYRPEIHAAEIVFLDPASCDPAEEDDEDDMPF